MRVQYFRAVLFQKYCVVGSGHNNYYISLGGIFKAGRKLHPLNIFLDVAGYIRHETFIL